MNDIIEKISFPQEWDVLKMRQCFSFGKGLSITKDDLVEEGIPVISYGQVHSKDNTGTGLSEELYRYVPESFLKTGKSCLVQKNDFIFADTSEDYAGVGNCAFIDNDDTIFAGYHSIIARPTSSTLYPKYLAYFFLTDLWRDQIRANVMGIKVFSITQQLLRDTYICVPPVSEQKRIVELLDEHCSKLDKIIANLERQIELLQKYKKSLITETVTKGLERNVEMKDSKVNYIGEIPISWDVQTLKYEVTKYDRGTSPDYTEEEMTPVVNQATFSKGFFDTTNIRYSTKTAKNSRGYLKKGDVLLASTGRGVLGKTYYFNEEGTFVADGHVTVIRTKNELDSKYLYYYFSVNYETFNEIMAEGSTNQTELQRDLLGLMQIPFPSLPEQQAITSFLDSKCKKIDDMLELKTKQLAVVNQYKNSRIYEYVTGKKRIKEAE
jgi:type I restriction enzyme S subunit